MSNTIQIKRFNEAGETPDDRGTVLAYGELAVNTADNTLWVGNNIGVNQLLSAHTRIGPDEPVMPADKLIGTFWFDTTLPESIKVWNGTDFVTFVGGDPVEPGGQVDSVVAGTNVTVDNTDPANPIVSATGGGGGSSDVEVLNDLDDVSVLGHSEGTQSRTSGGLPAAPGEFRLGGTFIQVYLDVEDHWALYELGDELTFVWNNGDVTGPFPVTTVMQIQNATVRTIYIDGTPGGGNPDDGGEGPGGGMTVLSNPERALPKIGEVLAYDGTNWVPQELAEFTDRAVLDDLDDVDLGFSVNAGIDDNVIGSVYEVPGAYRIPSNSSVLIYRNEIHDQMSSLQLGDIFYFRWPSVDEVAGPYQITNAPLVNDPSTYYLNWGAVGGGVPDPFTLPAGGPPMYITFGTPIGHTLVFDGTNWVSGKGLAAIQEASAAATDFADFQARIAAL